ncbi:Engulfment and cell motility protein 1 [Psilocybe cubensis]|uniref:Engulfment and cell motility protein 1 n=2 Tax=Psilocybe cubensis TaxID=181762 RepID=A0ACB8GUK8_PSICU|nr:Engulfment and cell motility protein 1 [Psilocybe cubensis]KAH9479433.1 Engulfment and cell motility protein 1 [Psilocybe cubensis]
MSTSGQNPSGARGSSGPSTSGNGTQAKSGALVPTNNVTTGDGMTVRTRIDPTLTVDDVMKQLCINLKIKEPYQNFALRDDMDELVTNDNLRKKIKNKVNLKLVNAPAREARETAEKLSNKNDKTLRLTLFSLQKFIREEAFAREFLDHNGLRELVDVIFTTTGNTLAYALTAMQNLMDLEYGWANLSDKFILRVVEILSSPQSLINVCRPATAILKKLVEADPSNVPGTQQAGSSRGPPVPQPGSVYRYGFQVVFEQMRKERGLLETVVNRLGSADMAMAQYSMMLINSLVAHASDARWEEFIKELERLNVRKAVVRLMSLHTVEDLTSCILDFQANIVRVTYRKKTTPVDPDDDEVSAEDLDIIWTSSKLEEEVDQYGQILKWRKLGFETEDISQEFSEVGQLGLYCLRKFVESDPDFSKIVLEQLSRPESRRCPIGKASNEVVELLSEHWAIFAPGYSTSTTFQPFFLDFPKVHALATHFFIRMWSESGAAADDFTRVAALVRSQVKVALRRENVRPWHEVEHDFMECEYRAVRDRQMKELELEDDLLSKIPVRNLRAKLYKESFEFVRQQRIQCLLQGAWFINALPASSPREGVRRPGRPWRFMRLDSGLKYLHYVDSAVKFPVRNGLEDLPERIDMSMISEIATGTCAPPPNVLRDQNDLPPTSALVPSPLSFSLLSAHEGSLADQIAPDQSRWADWTDGLNMLRRDGGHVSSKETAGFVQALTEIGLKIKLLDLSGEMVEIPSGLVAGPPPMNNDFFFSELM